MKNLREQRKQSHIEKLREERVLNLCMLISKKPDIDCLMKYDMECEKRQNQSLLNCDHYEKTYDKEETIEWLYQEEFNNQKKLLLEDLDRVIKEMEIN